MVRQQSTTAATVNRTHEALQEELERLEHAAQAPADAMPLELHNRLELVRARLVEYLRAEEQGGFLKDVLPPDPGPHRAAKELREEHRQLAQALDALIAETAFAPNDAALREKAARWV